MATMPLKEYMDVGRTFEEKKTEIMIEIGKKKIKGKNSSLKCWTLWWALFSSISYGIGGYDHNKWKA